jgi:enoyl-[acyl-carrier protein] reductase I
MDLLQTDTLQVAVRRTDFDELIAKAEAKAPAHRLVSIDDVGVVVAFLAMDGAKLITSETFYIDGGYHVID